MEAKLVQFELPDFQLKTRVLQLKIPPAVKYSLVYQKVQSSGSITTEL